MEEGNKKNKSVLLLEKVNLLAEKIENEPSFIKRTLYSIKAKLVIAKLEKQIEIINIKEKYENERIERVNDAELDKLDTRSEIIDLNARIIELERMLNNREEYDYNSNKFLFGKGEVERNGGIEEYTNSLINSGRIEQIKTADEIKETEKIKKELLKLKDELRYRQEDLQYIDEDLEYDNKQAKKQETALIVRKRFNIFEKIATFFKNIGAGIKEGLSEHKIIKEEKKKGINLGENIGYVTREQALKKLEEEYNKQVLEINQGYDEIERKFIETQAKSQAEQYRQKVKEAAEHKENMDLVKKDQENMVQKQKGEHDLEKD